MVDRRWSARGGPRSARDSPPSSFAALLLRILTLGIREMRQRDGFPITASPYWPALQRFIAELERAAEGAEVSRVADDGFNPGGWSHDDEPTITAAEAAAALGCSVQYVARLCRDGRLRARQDEARRWHIAKADVVERMTDES